MNKSLAQRLAVSGSLPRSLQGASGPLRIGLLAPLTGPLAPWGQPGLDGCLIWADWVNAQGGLVIGKTRRKVQIVARDAAGSPDEVRSAARDLVDQSGIAMLLTLGGDSIAPALPWLMARRVLTSTMLPFDLSPQTPTLIAPAEVHPLFVVTGVEWLARHRPDVKRVALCSQTDLMGLPSLATYRAAFAAEGMQIVREVLYDGTPDAATIVAALLEGNPQALCWCTSEPHMVHALTEAAFHAGFTGPILSCTCDSYRRLIARTSGSFMANLIFHFPDFDDPLLEGRAFFFRQPAGFHDSYRDRFPGHWSAVSWEFAAILDLWHSAVEIAGTTQSGPVLEAMKRGGQMMQVFGPARWYGESLFGLDNALVGSWPIVTIKDGAARIAAFGSVLDWLSRHEALLLREIEAVGLLWQQRALSPPA